MTSRGIWAAALVLACSDATAPAGPVQEAGLSTTPDATVAESQHEAAQPTNGPFAASATGDAADRLAASLEQLRPAADLRRVLTRLTVALASFDSGESELLLRQARRILEDLARGGEAFEMQPDLDAIGLALDAAERELEPSTERAALGVQDPE